MDVFNHYLHWLQDFLWGAPLLSIIIGVGIYLTIALKGFQFRYLGRSLHQAFISKDKNSTNEGAGDLTNFQALMTSLAAAIGTGNIAGVATAIAAGGLGALFWMWVMALLGMVIKYAEALLAVKYRIKNKHGEMSGGPMYYLDQGLGYKKLAMLYAFLGILACFGTGNLIQTHSVAEAMHSLFAVDHIYCGLILSIVTGIVMLGGVKRIGVVAEKVVPVMALCYVGFGVSILISHADLLPSVFMSIFYNAFDGHAAVGGFLGSTMSMAVKAGFSRGIASNEAGLGTSAIASAAAMSKHPGKPAMIAMTSVFLSTLVVCTITGLVIGVTGVLGQEHPLTGEMLNGAPMAATAFKRLLGGEYIVSLGLILFAFTTIVGWGYYGEKFVEYLLGLKWILAFRLLYVLCILLGAVLELHTVWAVSDITNGLMAIPNLLGILLLASVVKKETKEFEAMEKDA